MPKTIGPALAAVAGALLLIFVSSVALAETPVPADQSISAQATEPVAGSLTLLGQIMTGTPGSTLPVTTTVTLFALDGQNLAFTAQGTADASGKVRFDKVPYTAGRAYGLMAVEGGVKYYSDLTPPKEGEKSLTLPVKVYDTTTDASRLRVEQMYVVGQFVGDRELQIVNAYTLSNAGDRTVEGGERTALGEGATLRFYLPAGFRNVQFQGDDGKKFALTLDGFVTKEAVPPGTNTAQVVLRYTLPYSGQLQLATKTQYPVQKVSVLMADQGITLTSAALVDQGVQTGQDGVARRAYLGNGLAASASLTFGLSGSPKIAAPQPASPGNSAPPVSPPAEAQQPDKRLLGEVIVAVGLLAILVACVWSLIVRRSRSADTLGERRALFETLADLDEDHEAGKIGDADYVEQRSFLKAALLTALQDPAETVQAAAEGQA